MEDKKQKVQKFKKRLQHLLKNEEWEEALVVFDELILVRATPQRWCNRSFVLLQLGKIGLAIEGYKKALKLEPNHEIAHRGLAKAEEILRNLKAQDEEDYGVASENTTQEANEEQRLINQFQNFIKQKNWDQALIVLDELIAIKPTVERLCNQGTLLGKQGSLKLALSSYNGALQLDPDSEAAKKGVQRIQKMIYEVREGTKEEPLLAVQLVEDKSNTLMVFVIAAIVFVVIIALIQSMFNSGESVSQNDSIQEKTTDEQTKQHAAEQQAKGLIEHNGKWISPEQKFAAEQQAKGLVEHNGKWISPEQKFAAEQQAKGLIEHNGKWISPEQKFAAEQQAKGLIEHNGKWISPEQKFAAEQQAKGLIEYNGKWISLEEKFVAEQKAKGLIKYNNQWLTKEQWQQKQQLLHETLPKKLRDYHVYLEKECKKAAKNKEFKKAYLHLKKRIKKLEEFIGVDPDNPIVQKIRRKIPLHKSYIFPLRLFEQQRDVDLAFSPRKLDHLNKDIHQLQVKFLPTIAKRDTTIFQLQTLKTNIAKSEKDLNAIKNKIDSVVTLAARIKEIKNKIKRNKSDLIKLQNKEKQTESDINAAQEHLSQLRRKQSSSTELFELQQDLRQKQDSLNDTVDESRRLRREIDQLETRIRNSNDEQEKQRLRRQLTTAENQLKEKDRLEDELQEQLNSAESKVKQQEFAIQELENKRREAENTIANLRDEKATIKKEEEQMKREAFDLANEQRQKETQHQQAKQMLPQWKNDLQNAKTSLQSLKDNSYEQQQNLDNYNRELQPLVKLKERKYNILHVVDQYQRWWINLQNNKKAFLSGKNPVKEPLKNMLLALYALHNFSRENIRVKIHKGYRSLGKAAVTFQ